MATKRLVGWCPVDMPPARSRRPFDLLPCGASEKCRTCEPVSLRRLVDGIEQAGIERQIGPDRSAGVKNQWHHAEDGACGQCGGNLRIGSKRLNRARRWQRLAVVEI